MNKYTANEELLDNDGIWISGLDSEKLESVKGKIVVGFLEDSKEKVIGLFSKNGIAGYSCTHYRLLSEDEVKKFCIEEENNGVEVEIKFHLTREDIKSLIPDISIDNYFFNNETVDSIIIMKHGIILAHVFHSQSNREQFFSNKWENRLCFTVSNTIDTFYNNHKDIDYPNRDELSESILCDIDNDIDIDLNNIFQDELRTLPTKFIDTLGLGINVLVNSNLEVSKGETEARYSQVGIMSNCRFTGVITAYCGGGVYDTDYIIDGVSIDKLMPNLECTDEIEDYFTAKTSKQFLEACLQYEKYFVSTSEHGTPLVTNRVIDGLGGLETIADKKINASCSGDLWFAQGSLIPLINSGLIKFEKKEISKSKSKPRLN